MSYANTSLTKAYNYINWMNDFQHLNTNLPITAIWKPAYEALPAKKNLNYFSNKLASFSAQTISRFSSYISICKGYINDTINYVSNAYLTYMPIVKSTTFSAKNIVMEHAIKAWENFVNLYNQIALVASDLYKKSLTEVKSLVSQLGELVKAYPTETVVIISTLIVSALLIKLHSLNKELKTVKINNQTEIASLKDKKTDIEKQLHDEQIRIQTLENIFKLQQVKIA